MKVRRSTRPIRNLIALLRSRTEPTAFAVSLGVHMGLRCRCYGTDQATWGSEPYLIKLGDDVTVVSGARFLTHDGAVAIIRSRRPAADLIAPIRVGNRVFIGCGAIILPGTVIGDDCIIAAGAVVSGKVDHGQIVAGVPARTIGTVEDWYHRHEADFIDTGLLDPHAKRSFLLRYFGVE